MTLYEELVERGLIAQVTNEEEIKEMINNGKATFYIGFDCTADSLTAGHFMALTLMKRLQMAGNKPVALIGGGTTMIGDPSQTISRNFQVLNEASGLADRGTFVIDPDGIIQTVEVNADGIGRDTSILVNKIKAAQYVRNNPGEVCPAKWEEGTETLTPSLDLVGKI